MSLDSRDFSWGAVIRLIVIFAGLIALWMLVWPAKADASIQCASHAKMTAFLIEKYNEAPRANGTINSTNIMEMYVSMQGSWTVLLTRNDGLACIVAAGQNYEDVPHEPGPRT